MEAGIEANPSVLTLASCRLGEPPIGGVSIPGKWLVRPAAYFPILYRVRSITFSPKGFTGAGILIERITLAAALCHDAVSHLNGSGPLLLSSAVTALLLGAMVLLGLFTPIAAAIVTALACVCCAFDYRPLELSLVLAGLSLSLVFLGPGAWSLDARFFGLRRVEIEIDHVH